MVWRPSYVVALKGVALALGAAALLPLGGCRIVTHKNGNGKDNVDIGTPFGSMQVRTDDKASGVQTGLTPYPGATVVKKDGDENGAADINMSFGGFHLGVHALDLRTTDSPEKVLAFYRKDMSRYGTVVTCRGHDAVGTPVRTDEGLGCGADSNQATKRDLHVDHSDSTDHLELRAGSEKHQHIVGVHTEDGSTRIGLVAIDLPSGMSHHDASDRE